MLKPLLLLCWTAIFVSAGDQQIDGTNSTGVSVDSSQKNVIVQPELPLDNTKPATSSSEHVSSIQSEPLSNPPKLSDSSLDTKLKMSAPLASDEVIDVTTPIIKNAIISTTTTTSTTPSSTTTSTTSTTTTTTTSTTTTSAPTTPVPPPSTRKWMVKQDNKICIIVQMVAQFNFSYTVNNKTIQKMMDIPGNGTVSGICGNVEQNLTVSWNAQDTDNFTLHFMKNETTNHYSLHHFEISLAPEEFPADKWNETVTLIHMTPQYEIGLSNSYRCMKEQKLNLYMKDVNETVGRLTISKLQFQAFRSDNSTIFGVAKDCAFETPDIVPITVGCALAGLVVIVLIAYLVGRRRSQARGYLSM